MTLCAGHMTLMFGWGEIPRAGLPNRETKHVLRTLAKCKAGTLKMKLFWGGKIMGKIKNRIGILYSPIYTLLMCVCVCCKISGPFEKLWLLLPMTNKYCSQNIFFTMKVKHEKYTRECDYCIHHQQGLCTVLFPHFLHINIQHSGLLQMDLVTGRRLF